MTDHVHRNPQAVEALKRIDAIFDGERAINGRSPEDRLAARHATIAPLVADLEGWMRRERGRLSRHAEVAKAMDYLLKRWPAFTRFLDDGRICISNNAAERALRGIALGLGDWLVVLSIAGITGGMTGGLLAADKLMRSEARGALFASEL
jgi:transposase